MNTTVVNTPAATSPGSRGGSSPLALPISLFSIPLGLAGLGAAWAAAEQLLGASGVPATVAYAAATTVWVVFTLVYVAGTVRADSGSFRVDLRHPLLGPLTAYIPVIAILLTAHYAEPLGPTAVWLTYTAIAALTINAAALFAHWLTAPLDPDATHPGYFLPVVAGPFIASIGLASIDQSAAAVATFGVGIYFWLLLGAVITSRLFFGSPLPQPFKPVLSILLSPPGTASLAWFAITRGQIDDLQAAIGGVTLSAFSSNCSSSPTTCACPSALNTGSSRSPSQCWATSGSGGPPGQPSTGGRPWPGSCSPSPRPRSWPSLPEPCATASVG